jgi:hypothetical protein
MTGIFDVGSGGGGYSGSSTTLQIPSTLTRSTLAIATDNGSTTLTPTSGYKIRVWGFSYSFTHDATYAAATGERTAVFFTTNESIAEFAGYAVAGTARSQIQTAFFAIPFIGATDQVLTLQNTNWTAGTAVARLNVWYDEVV